MCGASSGNCSSRRARSERWTDDLSLVFWGVVILVFCFVPLVLDRLRVQGGRRGLRFFKHCLVDGKRLCG